MNCFVDFNEQLANKYLSIYLTCVCFDVQLWIKQALTHNFQLDNM